MGGCAGKTNEQEVLQPSNHRQQMISNVQGKERCDHPLNVNMKYTSFFTVVPDQFAGQGIRRTNAYNSRLSRAEWAAKRQEFWETRIEGKPHCWMAVRQACEVDERNNKITIPILLATAIAILAAAELKLVGKSIQILYDIQGHKYDVPVFCINEPLLFPEQDSTETGLRDAFDTQAIEVIVRCTKFPKDFQLQTQTTQLVGDLKAAVLQTFQQYGKVRLIFKGRELIDKHQLGQYDIQDKSVLQALCIAA